MIDGFKSSQLLLSEYFSIVSSRKYDCASSSHKEINSAWFKLPHFYNTERELIRLLFENNEEIIGLITYNIHEEDILVDIHRKIFEKVYFEYENRGSLNPSDLISLFDDEVQSYLRELTIEKYSLSNNWEDLNPSITQEMITKKYAIDLIVKYKQMHIDLQITANVNAQENADSEERLLELMKEKHELERLRKSVREEIEKQ